MQQYYVYGMVWYRTVSLLLLLCMGAKKKIEPLTTFGNSQESVV